MRERKNGSKQLYEEKSKKEKKKSYLIIAANDDDDEEEKITSMAKEKRGVFCTSKRTE